MVLSLFSPEKGLSFVTVDEKEIGYGTYCVCCKEWCCVDKEPFSHLRREIGSAMEKGYFSCKIIVYQISDHYASFSINNLHAFQLVYSKEKKAMLSEIKDIMSRECVDWISYIYIMSLMNPSPLVIDVCVEKDVKTHGYFFELFRRCFGDSCSRLKVV